MANRIDTADLRASTPISSVVGQTVQLHRRGNALMGRCPFHPDDNPSLSVSDELGLFHCFGCQESGDVIAFVMKRDCLTFQEAVESIQTGIGTAHQQPFHRPLRADTRDSQRAAKRIWDRAGPIQGSAAERYLRRRALPLEALPLLPSLRFTRLRYRDSTATHPALITALTSVDGEISGIQRTFLNDDGSKLNVGEPKLSLGRVKGSAIRLGNATDELVVCEGVEDGLSILLSIPGISVWATAGAGMMADIKLPDECRRVTVAADNDEAGRRAADIAVTAFLQMGKKARVMRPSAPFKDFNQELQGLSA